MPRSVYFLQCVPGRVLRLDPETHNVTTVVDKLNSHPDGLVVVDGRVYWTNMGPAASNGLHFFEADGSVQSAALDGSDVRTDVAQGQFVTGKQMTFADGQLYWTDREGMRVLRARPDGSSLEVLVQTGEFPRDAQDATRHCVGIAVDTATGRLFWTQKGPPKGGRGRIFTAPLDRAGQDPAHRDDIVVLSDNLPEPIDLELSADGRTLFWTDRGDAGSGGNSLNCAELENVQLKNARLLASGFDETIGLAVDEAAGTIYVTDLGGTVYAYREGKTEKLVTGLSLLTGIALGE